MSVAIISIVFLLVALSVLLIIRNSKIIKELEQNIEDIHKQIIGFSTDYDGFLQHYITESEESDFVATWNELYLRVSKCHLSKKHSAYAEIEQFKEIYRNLHKSISESNAEIKRKATLIRLSEQVPDFFAELTEITNKYVTHSIETWFTNKWQYLFSEIGKVIVREEDAGYHEISRFRTAYCSLNRYFSIANDNYIRSESIKHDSLFSNIDGKSLDEQQRTAVITDEDRILVLAGAGSGKTLTIAAKVKYLCDIKKVAPQDILLVSFTNKSAQEMTDRIQNKLGIKAEATTFHKLGLDIIKHSEGFRPEISDDDELSRFVHGFFENELFKYPDLIKSLTEYFAYSMSFYKALIYR